MTLLLIPATLNKFLNDKVSGSSRQKLCS